MLTFKVDRGEYFDNRKEEFITVPGAEITIEHSLKSIREWESRWKTPFFSDEEKTPEQILDYIRCMTINKNVDPIVYSFISAAVFKKIEDYLEDPMTGTKIYSNRPQDEAKKKPSKKKVSSEEIYFQMIALGIPVEWGEKLHFNYLKSLIHVCAIKSNPDKKMSKEEAAKYQRELNQQRRKAHMKHPG